MLGFPNNIYSYFALIILIIIIIIYIILRRCQARGSEDPAEPVHTMSSHLLSKKGSNSTAHTAKDIKTADETPPSSDEPKNQGGNPNRGFWKRIVGHICRLLPFHNHSQQSQQTCTTTPTESSTPVCANTPTSDAPCPTRNGKKGKHQPARRPRFYGLPSSSDGVDETGNSENVQRQITCERPKLKGPVFNPRTAESLGLIDHTRSSSRMSMEYTIISMDWIEKMKLIFNDVAYIPSFEFLGLLK